MMSVDERFEVHLVCQMRDEFVAEQGVALAVVGHADACVARRASWSKKNAKTHLLHGARYPLQSYVLTNLPIVPMGNDWEFRYEGRVIRARFNSRTEYINALNGKTRPRNKVIDKEEFLLLARPHVVLHAAGEWSVH